MSARSPVSSDLAFPSSIAAAPDLNHFPAPLQLNPIIEHIAVDHNHQHEIITTSCHGTSSIAGITFIANEPRDTAGSGLARHPAHIRDLSPPPAARFQRHVSFDNFGGGEPTEKNTISFTLNVKHKGYQFKRRSRTFMAGIDENSYSEIALQWMLDELVDDGDEIICVRIVDKDSKVVSDRNLETRQYQKEAKELMQRIQLKNDNNQAISIVLEFAVGKLHATFHRMIQLYEPAMLIVGTRGRSLGGFQGLMSNRNSFSKWCLQYSPVPVVVVRPTEKRMKKKKKRDADPTRQDYVRILRDSGIGEHETDSASQSSIWEVSNDPEVEAHEVAAALGLPNHFDLTPRPNHLEGSRPLIKIESDKSDVTSFSQESASLDSQPSSPILETRIPKDDFESAGVSADEYSDGDEEEGEFDVIAGHRLLDISEERPEIERKMKLHEMEVGEAAALARGRKGSTGSAESSDYLPGEASLMDEHHEEK